MKKLLLSVIVPVYNVEGYLSKCLDSICDQTYSNLEIIVVNDGSTDGCGEICRKYAQYDDRIILIEKENGGLSSARNAGLSIAKGEYIAFVDSDDWIDSDMFERMMNTAVSENADMVSCGIVFEYPNNPVIKSYGQLTVDRPSLMKEFIKGTLGGGSVWNKVYRKEYWSNVLFPVGKLFEDVGTLHWVVKDMQKAVVINDAMYHYILRNTSITHQHTLKHIKDNWDVFYERYCAVMSFPECSDDEELERLLLKSCVSAISRTWRWAYGLYKTDKTATKNLCMDVNAFVRSRYKLFGEKDYSKDYRLVVFLAHFNDSFTKLILYRANYIIRSGYNTIERIRNNKIYLVSN